MKSLIKIDDLITFLLDHKITACGICDENLFGVGEFYLKCLKNNIKPIIGLSIKLNRLNIYVYAKNYAGYQTLIKLEEIKEEREIAIIDLKKDVNNILIIVPFASKSLFNSLEFVNSLYLGYSNEYEKTNAKLLTNNCVYVNDIRSLKVDNLRYLNLLDLLREEDKENYANNYYHIDKNIVSEAEILKVVKELNVVIPLDKHYIPTFKKDVDSVAFLKTLALKGLNKRLNNNVSEVYQKRLSYELKVIIEMGFVDYFLIVYDYVLYAKKNNILVGCRGSAAGSLVSYAIGITDIDPIKYNLLFERFLNPARVTMPDIDIDFDALRRDEVINYVKTKYGINNVAGGLTFATFKSKLVLRDCAKILKINPILFDKFIKNIKANLKLSENCQNPVVQKYLQNYSEIKTLYQVAEKLEGLKKNISTHAAGIVISSVPLDTVIPVYHNNKDLITGIPMEYLEQMGLLKMDFLGLKNLTFINEIQKYLPHINLDKINLEDKKVFALFNNIDVEGIFQFETPVMQQFLTKFKIDSFNDLIAAIALVRPGPKDHIDSYIRRKKGLEKINYLHNDLAPILNETFGVIIYQEQIMAILTKIGGYSLGEADIIRRAISKKKDSVIKSEKTKFIARAQGRGYEEKISSQIYDDIAKFASFGFNKSHSVAYALFSYKMAYLKTYYRTLFYLALLNDNGDSKNEKYFLELKQQGIMIIKPSVLNRNLDYILKDNKLIMPLKTIKGITSEIATKINEVNENGFTDYFDFLAKTKDFLKEEQILALIKAGALDFLKMNHPTLVENLDNALNFIFLGDSNLIAQPEIIRYPDDDEKTKINEEYLAFGFYCSNHPASKYKDYVKSAMLASWQYKKIKMAVLITRIQVVKTKKGEKMAFLTGTDETGSAEFTVFPNSYNLLPKIKINDLVFINGEVIKRFDKYQIIVNNIKKDGE